MVVRNFVFSNFNYVSFRKLYLHILSSYLALVCSLFRAVILEYVTGSYIIRL